MARRCWLLVMLLLAALICAAFLLGLQRLAPRSWLFEVTGEERLVAQMQAVVQWAFRWMRPLPQPAADTPVAYTDLPPFGVNTFLEQEVEPVKRERSVQMIADAGLRWIRQSFPWYDIEVHGKGDFEDRRHDPARSAWEKYDHIVALAERYEVDIIARLEAPPAWSRHDGEVRGAFGPPDDFQDFADYAEAVVTRYRGRIRFYQVWNEPNIYPEWGHRPVDPEGYTELLCLAYRRIKAADPDAAVISGALAPTVELGTWNPNYQGNNLMDVVFLQRMYNAGAAACFDILAVNDYMLWSGPTDRRMRPGNVNFSRPLWVRDVMVANGDAAKPMWISEMNSNAAPDSIPPRFGRVTLEQQARYAPLAYQRIQEEWPWAGVVTIWFFKRASDAEQDQAMYYFRMVEPDFTPMPLYESMGAYLNTLTPTLYRGCHQESTWQLSYTGLWEDIADPDAILGRYRRAGGVDSSETRASLFLHWKGRTLALFPGPGQGRVLVAEDDGPAREVTLDGEPVILARHFIWGRSRVHTLTLTAFEGAVTIDALQVD
jgi:hypothetical protein